MKQDGQCFFDEMGWSYEYEPEGYELDNGTRYLPDFYLPEFKMFVEVKHENAIEEHDGCYRLKDKADNEKVDAFQNEVLDYKDKQVLFVTRGDPYNTLLNYGLVYGHGICVALIAKAYNKDVYIHGCNHSCEDCEAIASNFVTAGMIVSKAIFNNYKDLVHCKDDNPYIMCISWDEHSALIPYISNYGIKPMNIQVEDLINNDFAKLHAATIKARQARFEHGECG